MDRRELANALRRIKLGINPMNCLGCGHEHACSVHGCAAINEAIVSINTAEADLANKQRQIDALRQANEGLAFNLQRAAEYYADFLTDNGVSEIEI